MQIINITNNTTIATDVVVADTFKTRAIGLLNREGINDGEALVITRCQSIHMFFMKFAIDVIFADKNNRVVGLVKTIKPFCLSPLFFKANYAVELSSGTILATNTSIGDQIELA
ncbi:MAG: DUF192 domain-containing protein [Candidatus Zapsychrus exili]|nr:DUF192 domain-containing protein [Candidatus Zapsychrus exili]